MVQIKFGVRIPNSSFAATTENIRIIATEAERVGFHTLYLNDHINLTMQKHQNHRMGRGVPEDPSSTKDPNFFESLTTLAYLAGMTSKIELAVGVLFLPLRNPLVTAKQIATIDALSNGRLVLGVGVGNSTDSQELDLFGVPISERRDRAREYLEAMIEVWKEPVARYTGKFASFQGATVYPKPVQKPHPPVLMGGNSKRAMKVAAELCDGWIPHFMSPTEYAIKAGELRAMLAQFGRPSAGFQFAFQAFTCIDRDRTSAERTFFSTLGSGSKDFALGKTREGSPENLSRKGMVGTPDDVIARVEEFVVAGGTRYDAFFTYPNVESLVKQMRLFAADVVPSFQSH